MFFRKKNARIRTSRTTRLGGESLENRELKTTAMDLGIDFGPEPTAAVFVKFEGVDGESQDQDHGKWVDVLSVDTATTRAGFIKFDGIDGESQDRGHDKWSDVLSVDTTTTRAGFIKFDGIDGESQDRGHDKWCDVLDISAGTPESPMIRPS